VVKTVALTFALALVAALHVGAATVNVDCNKGGAR
jgi:hypothetical protein